MDLLDRLLKHDRWATDQLLEVSRGLSDAQLDQAFDIGHRTLRETFAQRKVEVRRGLEGLLVGEQERLGRHGDDVVVKGCCRDRGF